MKVKKKQRKATAKERKYIEAAKQQERRRLAAKTLDEAEQVVGPVRLRDDRHGDPETVLGDAAKRLRKRDDPWAEDLAIDCEDLADPPLDDED